MANDEEKKDFQLNFYEFLEDEEESSKDSAGDKDSPKEEKDFSSFEEESRLPAEARQPAPIDPSIKQDIDEIKALIDEPDIDEDTGFKPVIKDPGLPDEVLEIIDSMEKKNDLRRRGGGEPDILEAPAEAEPPVPEMPYDEAPDEDREENDEITDFEVSSGSKEDSILDAAAEEESAAGEITSIEDIIASAKESDILSIDGINVNPEPNEPEMDLDALLSEETAAEGEAHEIIDEPVVNASSDELIDTAELLEEEPEAPPEITTGPEQEPGEPAEVEEMPSLAAPGARPSDEPSDSGDEFADIDKFLEKEGLAQGAKTADAPPDKELDELDSLLGNAGFAEEAGIEEEPSEKDEGAASEKDESIKGVISDLSDILDSTSHDNTPALESKGEDLLPEDLLQDLKEFDQQSSEILEAPSPAAELPEETASDAAPVQEASSEQPEAPAPEGSVSAPAAGADDEKDYLEFNLEDLAGGASSPQPPADAEPLPENKDAEMEIREDLSERSFGAIPEEEQTQDERNAGSYTNSDEFYEQVQALSPELRGQLLRKIEAEKPSESDIKKYLGHLKSGGGEEASPGKEEIDLSHAVQKARKAEEQKEKKEKKPRSAAGIGVFAGIAAGALLVLISLYFIISGISDNIRANALGRKIAANNLKDIEADISALDKGSSGREKLYKMLSVSFMNIKNYPLAGKYLEKLINFKPDDLEYRNLLVKYYILTGNLLSAKDECQKIIDIEPRGLDGLLNMSDIYLILKDYEKARDRVYRALQLYPKNLDALLQLRKVYVKEGDTKKALAIHLELMEKAGKSLSTLDANLELVKLYMDEKQLENAKKLVDGLIITSQQSPKARYYRARIFYLNKDEESAIKDVKYALDLKPDYAECYSLLGDIYYRSKLIKQADENYKRAIELDPDLSDPHLKLGKMYLFDIEQTDRALKEFKDAEHLGEASPLLNYYMGLAYAYQGSYEDALKRYTLYLPHAEDDVYFNYNFANCLVKSGKYAEAEQYYKSSVAVAKKIVRSNWENTENLQLLGKIYNNFAMSYEMRGEKKLANLYYWKSVEELEGRDLNNPLAKANLSRNFKGQPAGEPSPFMFKDILKYNEKM